ncbi:cytochrome C assembly family protein [Pararhodospirillum photometricum]|uniref:Cytochrome c assembly protein n=1 Tax=Pararhodospirillum photometricum DSM 122 TaxID=1150469 RepID=H6SKR7_PARPM|nr:cytochrome c biogenesis protein CcsA [Pararhodospirillum photometricum]CCG08582.1 Cytochrome c assembly protein [Pararhodospirillum photometricum DSM 122]
MIGFLALHVVGLASLLPAALMPLRHPPRRDGVFWLSLMLAAMGAMAVALVPATLEGGWNTSFSNALWASIATALCLYGVMCVVKPAAWRLVPILLPYLMGLGLMANVWAGFETTRVLVASGTPPFWTMLHIAIALLTYGLLTNAAMAAVAGLIQERALKAKRPTDLTRRLPAAAEADDLTTLLLFGSEGVLALGLISGMGLQYVESGTFLVLDHKTTLSLLAFLVIGGLLYARYRWGVRGRLAARLLMLAYLLLTLAFPGIKFITDFLL